METAARSALHLPPARVPVPRGPRRTLIKMTYDTEKMNCRPNEREGSQAVLEVTDEGPGQRFRAGDHGLGPVLIISSDAMSPALVS